MSDSPADFARQFDERQQAAEEARIAAEKAKAEAVAAHAEAELLSPFAAVFVEHDALAPDGTMVKRAGTFRYKVAVTAADHLAMQCAMQRFTPPGLFVVPSMAQTLAVVHVTMTEVPDWIPRDSAGRPDWLNVDSTMVEGLADEVDKHAARFRERIGARCTPASAGHKPG